MMPVIGSLSSIWNEPSGEAPVVEQGINIPLPIRPPPPVDAVRERQSTYTADAKRFFEEEECTIFKFSDC